MPLVLFYLAVVQRWCNAFMGHDPSVRSRVDYVITLAPLFSRFLYFFLGFRVFSKSMGCLYNRQWPFFIYFVFCDLCALFSEELACIPCLLGYNLFTCFNYISWFLAEFFCSNHISSFFWVSLAFSGFLFKQIKVSSHGFRS